MTYIYLLVSLLAVDRRPVNRVAGAAMIGFGGKLRLVRD
jgi:hypothetical protein